jgi:hypothetical protein
MVYSIRLTAALMLMLALAAGPGEGSAAIHAAKNRIARPHKHIVPNPKHALLYVADEAQSVVTIYDLSILGAPAVQQITTGVSGPEVISIDAGGTLYVGNNNNDDVTIYPFGATAPSATLTATGTDPSGVAALPDGTVYVAGRGPSLIDVYAPGQTTPSHVITGSLIMSPSQIEFDATGNLYVADNLSGAYVIPAGTTQPVSLNLTGLDGASGIALDPRLHRLYVSSVNTPNTYVSAFTLGQTAPLYTMQTVDPDNLAFGGPHFEYLFVPDFFGYEVDVYRPGGTAPIAKLPVTFNSQSVAYKPPHDH